VVIAWDPGIVKSVMWNEIVLFYNLTSVNLNVGVHNLTSVNLNVGVLTFSFYVITRVALFIDSDLVNITLILFIHLFEMAGQ
jgi:hypothetical protein